MLRTFSLIILIFTAWNNECHSLLSSITRVRLDSLPLDLSHLLMKLGNLMFHFRLWRKFCFTGSFLALLSFVQRRLCVSWYGRLGDPHIWRVTFEIQCFIKYKRWGFSFLTFWIIDDICFHFFLLLSNQLACLCLADVQSTAEQFGCCAWRYSEMARDEMNEEKLF